MRSAGVDLLVKLAREQDLETYLKQDFIKKQFTSAEREVFNFINAHVTKHGKLPAIETLEKTLACKFLKTKEPLSYYCEQFKTRVIKEHLHAKIQEIDVLFGDKAGLDEEKLLRLLSSAAFEVIKKATRKKIYDFRVDHKLIWEAYHNKLLGKDCGLELGWPTLDKMTNGLVGGDVVSIVGRPKMGKTFMLLYSAHHVWTTTKKRPLFVSMEMSPLQIFQRLTCIYTSRTINQLNSATFSTKTLKHVEKELNKVKNFDTPFWLYHGGSKTTVDDICVMAHHLQPNVIYIDGAYMLKHPNTRLNKTDRVAEVMDDIKFKLATDNNIPVVCTYQFSREATKKIDKGKKPGLETIAHSDAVGMYSSLVMGLFESDTVETATRRIVEILAGRSGETGEFRINWDFSRMDFSQADAEVGDVISYF